MDYFTVEIAGRAIASFRSPDRQEAEELFNAEDFREDLTVLESEGVPLWDEKVTIVLRDATPEEVSIVDQAYENDDGEGEDDEEFVIFLVPVSDPTDDDADEDEE